MTMPLGGQASFPSPAASGNRAHQSCVVCPKSHSWEVAELGFELRAPESERADGTVGPDRGRCCSDLPVTLDSTSPFWPMHSAHRKPGWGLPCPSCLQPGGHGVLASPTTATPDLPLPVLCKTRRPLRGMAGGCGGWVDGLTGASQGRSLPAVTTHTPGLGSRPFLLLLCCPKVQTALSKKLWGPRKLERCPDNILSQKSRPRLWLLWRGS